MVERGPHPAGESQGWQASEHCPGVSSIRSCAFPVLGWWRGYSKGMTLRASSHELFCLLNGGSTVMALGPSLFRGPFSIHDSRHPTSQPLSLQGTYVRIPSNAISFNPCPDDHVTGGEKKVNNNTEHGAWMMPTFRSLAWKENTGPQLTFPRRVMPFYHMQDSVLLNNCNACYRYWTINHCDHFVWQPLDEIRMRPDQKQ